VTATPAEQPHDHTAAVGFRTTLRALRNPNFGPYFAGNALSNCGTWFQTLGQSLLIYRLTHSTLLLGVVNFSQFAGIFVFAPWSGAASDRYDRRRLLVVTQLLATAITALLALLVALGAANPALVIGLVLLLGTTTAFAVPAGQALLPSLVPREQLAAAVALNSVTYNLARAVGPALAAVVISQVGIAAAMGVNSLSYLALVAAVLVVHPREPQHRSSSRPRLRDSLAIVWADRRLAGWLAVAAIVGLSSDPVTTLSPAFATRVFDIPDTRAGYLVGAFGFGAVTAAFTIAARARRSQGRLVMTLALLAGGIAAFALSPSFAVALPALFVAGFGYLSSNTHVTTSLQLEIDDAQRGRIMALWSIAFLGSRPIASLIDGGLASVVGVRQAALVMSLPAAVAALAVARGLRRSPR
jgi:MFS family permease